MYGMWTKNSQMIVLIEDTICRNPLTTTDVRCAVKILKRSASGISELKRIWKLSTIPSTVSTKSRIGCTATPARRFTSEKKLWT